MGGHVAQGLGSAAGQRHGVSLRHGSCWAVHVWGLITSWQLPWCPGHPTPPGVGSWEVMPVAGVSRCAQGLCCGCCCCVCCCAIQWCSSSSKGSSPVGFTGSKCVSLSVSGGDVVVLMCVSRGIICRSAVNKGFCVTLCSMGNTGLKHSSAATARLLSCCCLRWCKVLACAHAWRGACLWTRWVAEASSSCSGPEGCCVTCKLQGKRSSWQESSQGVLVEHHAPEVKQPAQLPSRRCAAGHWPAWVLLAVRCSLASG
jgi:hypothetical protein